MGPHTRLIGAPRKKKLPALGSLPVTPGALDLSLPIRSITKHQIINKEKPGIDISHFRST